MHSYNPSLSFLGSYGVFYAKVNITGLGVGGENSNKNRAGRTAQAGRDRGNREREGPARAGLYIRIGEGENPTVVRGCAVVRGVLIGGRRRRQSGLDHTILGTAKTADSSRLYRGCPRPTWTWDSSRKPISRTESTPGLDGYSFVTMDTPIQHRGGFLVFYRASPWFAVYAIHKFGPNIVRFQLTTEDRRWYII